MKPTFDIPPIGPKQGKCWGITQLVFARNDTEVHQLRADKGFRCSRHSHLHKWNRFLVITGRLRICVWQEDGTMDETVLGPGQITDVPPGVDHRFEVIQDTLAVEFYWVGLEVGDIVRCDEGGPMEEELHGGAVFINQPPVNNGTCGEEE
jgi:mannose-6-phosphate isomerase-like protein (cupin superfamily)